MKNFKRILLTVVSALLLMAVTVAGTLAYLQATTNTVTNTFTKGEVHFGDEENLNDGLTEADVDKYGNPYQTDGTTKLVDAEDYVWDTHYEQTKRVTTNDYKLLAGHEYVKDPTATIGDESEPCYVRMFVTINCYETMNALCGDPFTGGKFFSGWDVNDWEYKSVAAASDGTATYEFWFVGTDDENDPKLYENGVVDAREQAVTLPALFTHFTLPIEATNAQIDILDNLEITIVAQAIQEDGFDTADAAWAVWDADQQ